MNWYIVLYIYVVASVATFITVVAGRVIRRDEDTTLVDLFAVLFWSVFPGANIIVLLYHAADPIGDILNWIFRCMCNLGDVVIIKKRG
jgi:hypothetical protein